MAASHKPVWALDPADVTWAWSGSTSGRRKKASQTRALDVTSWQLRLVHKPTGIEATGEVPAGHYSRVQMRALKDGVYARTYQELEARVARHLRIPGR